MKSPAGSLALRIVRRALGLLVNDFRRSELVLTLIFYLRLAYFAQFRRALRTQDSERAFETTLMHNLKSLGRRLNRMQLLIEPLSVLESVDKTSRVLVVGPRNEWDLMLLVRSGFKFRNCVGLDLISYAPSIHLGDMHSMPFADGEFDVVLCGWTLSYSAAPEMACAEIARVCRPGGVIGIAVEYFSGDAESERIATGGYVIHDDRLDSRINSVPQILALFGDHGALHFAHDAPLKRSVPYDPIPSNCAVLFCNS